ncbi:MAG: amidohydrolase family protein, partial [Gammaproteobacteria bacterium]
EIERVARANANVVHCPESNLKLASGLCAVDKLMQAGINVAIGTDGAASNNDLSVLGDTRTASLLAKGIAGDATALPAARALQMATLGGARALGMAERIGSLEQGKRADLTAVDLSALETQPIFDPISQLIYAASSRQVSDVWIDGVRRLREGELTSLDIDEVTAKTAAWGARMREVNP